MGALSSMLASNVVEDVPLFDIVITITLLLCGVFLVLLLLGSFFLHFFGNKGEVEQEDSVNTEKDEFSKDEQNDLASTEEHQAKIRRKTPVVTEKEVLQAEQKMPSTREPSESHGFFDLGVSLLNGETVRASVQAWSFWSVFFGKEEQVMLTESRMIYILFKPLIIAVVTGHFHSIGVIPLGHVSAIETSRRRSPLVAMITFLCFVSGIYLLDHTGTIRFADFGYLLPAIIFFVIWLFATMDSLTVIVGGIRVITISGRMSGYEINALIHRYSVLTRRDFQKPKHDAP
jgi:ABC-type multidrug transport system fused ATPase/permease subunit